MHAASPLEQAATGISIVIVPGWGGSGPGHWQSLWAQRLSQSIRVASSYCISG
jgi:predicted alpha/beta hydrolase family esterase